MAQLSAKWNNISSSSISHTCTSMNSYCVLQCSGCNPTPMPTLTITRPSIRRFVTPPSNKTISTSKMTKESKKPQRTLDKRKKEVRLENEEDPKERETRHNFQ